MQCPFLIEAKPALCETGVFGMIQTKTKDYKRFCTGRTYHLCQVYKANTGTADPKDCMASISSRLVKV